MIQDDIFAYIPQRPPFVMIDKLLSADEQAIRTIFTIRAGHQLVKNSRFTEAGLVENMAQTAASGTGYIARQEGKAAPVGFIGALKNLVVNDLPGIGETIHTEVIFVHQVMNAHIVEAKVSCDNRILATCELKIFLQADS